MALLAHFLLVRASDICHNNLTGTSLVRGLSERLNETLPNVYRDLSFRYFAELLDFGLVECESLRFLGTNASNGQTGHTLLIIPDNTFEKGSASYNRGLNDIISMGHEMACQVLESSLIQGLMNMRMLQNGDVIATSTNAGTSNVLSTSQLKVRIVQDTNVRQMRLYNYLGRFANVLVGNIQLCDLLSVNIIDSFLISTPSAFSSVYSIASRTPELSITYEAYRVTENLRVQFESDENNGYLDASGASSIKTCTFADSHPFRTYFIGSNRAWRRFFRRTQLTKSAIFADPMFLLSILLYTEARVINGANIGNIGLDAYLTTSFTYGQKLKPVGVNSILSSIPGQIEAPGIVIDAADVALFAPRSIKISGLGTSSRESNTAQVIVADIFACTGVVHVIDDILIPPTLTAFRQISLRSELSMFGEMLRAPINSALLLELDMPTASNVFVDGIAFAPTNVAIQLALTYMGWQFHELMLHDKLLKQIVEYHVIGSRPVVDNRLAFRVGLVRDRKDFATRLVYPRLARQTGTFQGVPIAKKLTIVNDYSASSVPKLAVFLYPLQTRLTVQGRMNSAELIRRDIPSTNGVLGILNSMLIPPTAELGLSLYDRIERTPELRIFEELVSILGLRPELLRHGFGNTESTIFAPNNAAWFKLLGELITTQEEVVNSHSALLYDLIMLTVVPRKESYEQTTQEIYNPWQSKNIRDGDDLITALSAYSEVLMHRTN